MKKNHSGGGRSIRTIGILILLCCLSVVLGAQTANKDDLSSALAGFILALNRVEDSSESSGQNLDASFSWIEVDEEDAFYCQLLFKNFRFYVLEEIPGKNRTITLNGDLKWGEGDSFNGSLSVEGAASVRSINFAGYDLSGYEDTGTVSVNNRPYDNNAFSEILENADDWVSDNQVYDADIESCLVFLSLFMAMGETDLDERTRDMDLSGGMPPPGIKAFNREKTVTLITREKGLALEYAGYTPTKIPDAALVPVLNGEVTMDYEMEDDDLEAMILTGNIRIGNSSIVLSMGFDSCRLEEGLGRFAESPQGKKNFGTVVINGKKYPFQDLLIAMDQIF
jgi:hypothetical protein